MSADRNPHRNKISDVGRMMRHAEARARREGRRVAADPAYLDQLAHHLADAAHLPLDMAKARVQQIAVSARVRDEAQRYGFQARASK